jgi:ATP-dependent Clp protease ATP-binding subunit ClpB
LEAAASLSDRYITARFLPDKAIDLVDEAASKHVIDAQSMTPELREFKSRLDELERQVEAAASKQDYEAAARLRSEVLQIKGEYDEKKAEWEKTTGYGNGNELVVTPQDIAALIGSITGIPVNRMLEDEAEKLLHMEENLHDKIVGQDAAITALSDAIRRARSGLKDPKRPIGSFIFLGPTGVGKTELAKALAGYMFDDEDAMVRIDMSEYGERHTVSRLIGAPPGYVGYEEGGVLTEAVRRRPYQVILFDEIEKAHPDVFNVLLQVLDDGRLTDGQGRTVDFRNTLIVMTSNLGGELLANLGDNEDVDRVRDAVMDIVRAHFRPEFLNRLDDIILFHRLKKSEMGAIVGIQLKRLQKLLEERKITLDLDESALIWLAEKGYDPVYGARPLKRVIQREVQDPLADKILAGDVPDGSKVKITAGADKLLFLPRVEGGKDEKKKGRAA